MLFEGYETFPEHDPELPEPELSPEGALWQAVVRQAVRERDWEFLESRDGEQACAFAGIDHEVLMFRLKDCMTGCCQHRLCAEARQLTAAG